MIVDKNGFSNPQLKCLPNALELTMKASGDEMPRILETKQNCQSKFEIKSDAIQDADLSLVTSELSEYSRTHSRES